MNMDVGKGNNVILQITSNIQQLNQNVQSLNVFVDRIGEAGEDGYDKSSMNELIQNSNTLAKRIKELINELVRLSDNNRQFRVQRERLTEDYLAVLKRLQDVQRKAVTKERSKIKAVTIEDEMLSRGDDHQQQTQMQMQHRLNLNEIKERQEALSQLETDIDDVNQIFKDLARIVHDQGEIVDSIEANIEHASIYTDHARADVQQAVVYQQKTRQKKMLLCVFFALLMLILLLVLFLWRN